MMNGSILGLPSNIPALATGAGSYNTAQTRMAAEFYSEVADATAGYPSTNPISLTGHSLGGGLAGFVGSIYGVDAAMFDCARKCVRRMAKFFESASKQFQPFQLPMQAKLQGGAA